MKENFKELLLQLEKVTMNDDNFKLLEKRARMLARNNFGNDSVQLKDIVSISYTPLIYSSNSSDDLWERSFNSGLRQLKNVIRVIIEEIELTEGIGNNKSNNYSMEIFISHSSKNKLIAKTLADLLKNSLLLANEKICCTSADGYRLKAGANTNEILKKEINESRVFIGLITEESLQSTYVLFELGARWGVEKPLIPIVINEKDKILLQDPLKGYNVLSLNSDSQILQLIENISDILDIKPQPSSTYSEYVNELIELSKTN